AATRGAGLTEKCNSWQVELRVGLTVSGTEKSYAVFLLHVKCEVLGEELFEAHAREVMKGSRVRWKVVADLHVVHGAVRVPRDLDVVMVFVLVLLYERRGLLGWTLRERVEDERRTRLHHRCELRDTIIVEPIV